VNRHLKYAAALALFSGVGLITQAHAGTCESLNDEVAKNGSWKTAEYLAKNGPPEMDHTAAFNWAQTVISYCYKNPYDDLASVMASPSEAPAKDKPPHANSKYV
jgi:hypothetical protein